jgi:tetratricopeptide (TPR) repeat protein
MPYLGSLTLDHLLKSISDRPGSFPKSGRELLSTLFDKQSTTVESRPTRLPDKLVPTAKAESVVATPILDMMTRFSHIEAVLWMGARVADGLAHAHERGILHLDLKPANILLTDDGQPMLLDFNLSIDLNDVGSLQMARLGGTLPYMSPEQLEAFGGGKRDIDARSDLFTLGLILFEMLTGTSAFPRRIGRMKDVVEALKTDRRTVRPSPRKHNPAISPAVAAILQKLLEADRTRRYQSAAELREDLERQLADLPLKYAPDRSIPERTRKWRRRHKRLSVAIVVGLAATVLLLMPATVLAVRQSQIAERKMQTETAEARQLWQEFGKESRTVQVLLATHTGERSQFDEGIERGKAVLERYGIGRDPDWMMQPMFARLSAEEQKLVRLELGEMLLFMARGEQILTGDVTDPTAVRWNELAAGCYPSDQMPNMLFEQRTELPKTLPRDADGIAIPTRPEGSMVEYDAYHDGVDYAMAGRYREALTLLRPFTEEHPRHYKSWFVRGICHDRIGEMAEAAACWAACIALDPEMVHAYFNRGIVRLKELDFHRANRDFTRALELRPGWAEALMNRAIARKGIKDYGGAIRDLKEVIAKPGSSVRARFLLAEIKGLDKKPDEAKIEFAEAMKIEPNDELGWSTRGYSRMDTEPAAALKDFDKAIALNPRSHEALINKSIVLSESLNRPREAVAVLDQFLIYYPDHIGARMGRGVVLARLGECEKARRDVEEGLKHDRSSFFLFQAAGLYAQISRHERGTDAKQEALALLGSALRKGFADLELFKTDTDLNPIREEAEFKRLLEVAAGLKKSAMR